MHLLRLITQLKYNEGYRALPYKDTLGNWTIGYGTTHLDGRKVDAGWGRIDKAQATRMLYFNLADSVETASTFVNNFYKLHSRQQEVLTDMAYQLGHEGLNKFKRTKKAIETGNQKLAYDELLDSRWARQTPARARRVANVFIKYKINT